MVGFPWLRNGGFAWFQVKVLALIHPWCNAWYWFGGHAIIPRNRLGGNGSVTIICAGRFEYRNSFLMCALLESHPGISGTKQKFAIGLYFYQHV